MSTDVHHYYAILGVAPEASEREIRGAFRRRAKELHPDAQSGNASAFIFLKRAYDTLSDPQHRAAYDRACQPPPPPPPRRPMGAQHRRASYYSIPPIPSPALRSKPSRRGGVGLVRYAIAFLIMAAISLGGVQAMIILTEAPPSIQIRAPGHTVTTAEASPTPTSVAEPSIAPGSSKSGFWDPIPSPSGKTTP